jgi:hypothetical protein
VKAGKEALSRHPQTEVPLPEPFDDVLVTRAELEALIRPSLLRSVELLAATIRSTGLSPDRLAGIYLVGGSSRIPLIATLIAEQLRVVPTSLDQPETAVALGAHHVTQEGVSLRTANLGSAIARPPTGAFPAAAPHTGPNPAMQPPPTRPAAPQTGPNPLPTQPVGPPPTGAIPAAQHTPYPTQPAKSRRTLFIGVGAVVVLAVAALVAVLALRPTSDLPTAEDCLQKGETDSQGFSQCLRQLAGTVADGDCEPAEQDSGADVSCTLSDDYEVRYAHLASVEDAQEVEATQLGNMTEGDHVLAEWSGNGLSGRYRAGVSGGSGVLVFTVADRPLVGWLMKTELRGDDLAPDALADFFDENVQPGT